MPAWQLPPSLGRGCSTKKSAIYLFVLLSHIQLLLIRGREDRMDGGLAEAGDQDPRFGDGVGGRGEGGRRWAWREVRG